MSFRSGHHSENPQHHPHEHGRPSARRAQPKHAKSSPREEDGYTLVHAGKQVRFGPVVFWIVVGTVVLLGMWSAATATYFAFRDDVLTRLISRQTDMQYGYEDRIAELRAQVDRMSSRQLLDQEQYEQKLDQIVRRQTTLESRANALNNLADTDLTGTVSQPQRNDPPGTAPFKPPPPNLAPAAHGARLPGARTTARDANDGLEGVLARLQQSLDRVE